MSIRKIQLMVFALVSFFFMQACTESHKSENDVAVETANDQILKSDVKPKRADPRIEAAGY